jgi:hypothetical protein|tara:strand:+ start:555 stop:1160 length:606 start_codon:yes stop_codon:yes gene_type:complete
MPLYTSRNSRRIYHIHIPRTAGRYVSSLFLFNKFNIHYNSFDVQVDGYDLTHLPYPYYNELEGVANVKKFAVIRNPFDRFASILKMLVTFGIFDRNYFEFTVNQTSFENIRDTIFDSLDQFPYALPQYKYIDDNVYLWKCESGMGYDFVKWINSNFDLDFRFNEVSYSRDRYDDCHNIQICDKVRDVVAEYYKKDFELFDY